LACSCPNFPDGNEVDLEAAKLRERRYQLLNRSSEPVKAPNQDDCKAAATCISHESFQPRPVPFGATCPVEIDADDVPTTLFRKLPEGLLLNVGVLFMG